MATTTTVTATPSATPQFPALDLKGKNTVQTAVEMLQKERILVIHATGKCRIFHNLGKDPIDLAKREVVYYNCDNWPGLLGEGELDFEINNALSSAVELVNKPVKDTSDGKTSPEAVDQMRTRLHPVQITGAADLLGKITRHDVPYYLEAVVP